MFVCPNSLSRYIRPGSHKTQKGIHLYWIIFAPSFFGRDIEQDPQITHTQTSTSMLLHGWILSFYAISGPQQMPVWLKAVQIVNRRFTTFPLKCHLIQYSDDCRFLLCTRKHRFGQHSRQSAKSEQWKMPERWAGNEAKPFPRKLTTPSSVREYSLIPAAIDTGIDLCVGTARMPTTRMPTQPTSTSAHSLEGSGCTTESSSQRWQALKTVLGNFPIQNGKLKSAMYCSLKLFFLQVHAFLESTVPEQQSNLNNLWREAPADPKSDPHYLLLLWPLERKLWNTWRKLGGETDKGQP